MSKKETAAPAVNPEVAAAAAAKAEAKLKADAAKAEAKKVADEAKAVAKAAAEEAKAKAKAEKEAAAAAAKAEKEAKAKAAAEAKAQAKPAKVALPSQNGVTRPRAEGKCGQVWAIADTISARIGQPVPISMLHTEAVAAGLNDATIRTQYARWKTFNGVFGVVAKPAEAVAA